MPFLINQLRNYDRLNVSDLIDSCKNPTCPPFIHFSYLSISMSSTYFDQTKGTWTLIRATFEWQLVSWNGSSSFGSCLRNGLFFPASIFGSQMSGNPGDQSRLFWFFKLMLQGLGFTFGAPRLSNRMAGVIDAGSGGFLGYCVSFER